ncbi:MAG: 2-hydroxyacyl-CoA dehydratase family protein [Dehalococcoidales bacterium]|nr:2-hydroxyacyl-CoA dehydratase family protein [Dehalococcoidales bacterium]
MVTSSTAKKALKTTLEVSTLRKNYYAQNIDDSQKGKKVAWCSNNIPTEILDVMDVTSVFLENYATVIASKKLGSGYCAAGEKKGFSQDVCGYARMLMGYVLAREEVPEAPYGGLAKPDFLLVNSYSCDSRLGWFTAMSRALNIPVHVHDAPHQPDGACDLAPNAEYVERELRSLVAFLEEQTGKKFDPDRLRQRLSLSRQTSNITFDINQLRKAVPCPMGSADMFTAIWPALYMVGTKECEDFYQKLRAEVEERIANKVGVVPDEKFRLMWSGIPFWYNMRLLNYAEEFGGVVVIESLFNSRERRLPAQDDDPIRDMALSSIRQRNYPGTIAESIDDLLYTVKEYKVDGVIQSFNPSCRMSYVSQSELQKALEDRGIPTLGLECDMADERTYSEGQVKTRMEAFFERLLAKA